MAIYFNSSQFPNFEQKSSWKVIVGAILGLIALFWLAKGVFFILNIIAPFLLIITLILNYKVVLGYGTWLLELIKRDLLLGILAAIGTVFFFPVVSAYLFGKMLLLRKVNKMKNEFNAQNTFYQNEEFTSYEEVEEIAPNILKLPKTAEKQTNSNNYDTFFEQK
jgi:hypothetical protein